MIYLLEVLVEHKVDKLDQVFYYYSKSPVFKYCRVEIDFRNQHIVGFVVDVKESEKEVQELSDKLGFVLKEISKIIDEKPIFDDNLFKLASLIHDRYFYPLIGVINTMLSPSLRSKSSYDKGPKIAYNNYYKIKDSNFFPRDKREEALISKFSSVPMILSKDLHKSKTLEKLVEEGIIEVVQVEKYRYVAKKIFEYDKNFVLSKEQDDVYKDILLSRENIFLIKGVTGSGKTQIYLKLIEDALKSDMSSLILVPEIALTPLMISRILSYFDEEIAVLHSGLTLSQLYDEYRKISENKCRIVIGARSAIFAPLKNLKYIFIDEEHDDSYRQEHDLTYNAKDIAFMRSKIEGCKVILGSATPSIEVMAKCKKGEYKEEILSQKYFKEANNTVEIVDTTQKNCFVKSKYFSETLIKKMNERLKNNEKIIILVNRKGSGSLKCDDCGYVYKCPNCNLPLIYHQIGNKLVCHHCDFNINFKKECPICFSNKFSFVGVGIEVIEKEFERLFPKVRYCSLDKDRAKTSDVVEDVLKTFASHDCNVLIGTQMVSKGHDFKDVSLVAIINADQMLYVPTYQANEVAFSTLVQTIGRSGRFINGEAIVQTKNPQNEIINFAINNDYNGFFEYEIKRRMKYKYPPFSNLVVLRVASNDINYLKNEILNIKEQVKAILKDDEITFSMFQERYKAYFSFKIFVKSKKLSLTREYLKEFISKMSSNNKIRFFIELD